MYLLAAIKVTLDKNLLKYKTKIFSIQLKFPIIH